MEYENLVMELAHTNRKQHLTVAPIQNETSAKLSVINRFLDKEHLNVS